MQEDDIPFKEDIPFEDAHGNLSPSIDGALSERKTTVTGTERAAFEKLYRTFKGQGRPRADNGGLPELDQIADEYYEEDEEAAATIEKVFDAVLQGSSRSPQAQKDGPESVKDASMPGPTIAQNKNKSTVHAEIEKVRKLRTEERERVDALLKNASTDEKLWQILEKEVFDRLRNLDLDATTPTKTPTAKGNSPKNKPKPITTPAADKRVLFPNYQHYLHVGLLTLRTHFPSSQLALTILPTLKSLGRSSYALGATTTLYKHLLRTAWIQQSSYSFIDMLLSDMDNNMVEFDGGILAVLDAVIKEHDLALGGTLGREMQMVYGMEQWVEGITKIKEWRDMVAGRLGIKRDEVPLARVVRRPVERPEGVRRDAAARPVDTPFVGRRGVDKVAQPTTQNDTRESIPFARMRRVNVRDAPPAEDSRDEQSDNDEETRPKILL